MIVSFSGHAKAKIKERKIDVALIKRILNKPDLLYYDLLSRALIGIGRKIIISDTDTNLIIPFRKDKRNILVITVYPCRDLEKELKRKEGVRWVKIE